MLSENIARNMHQRRQYDAQHGVWWWFSCIYERLQLIVGLTQNIRRDINDYIGTVSSLQRSSFTDYVANIVVVVQQRVVTFVAFPTVIMTTIIDRITRPETVQTNIDFLAYSFCAAVERFKDSLQLKIKWLDLRNEHLNNNFGLNRR